MVSLPWITQKHTTWSPCCRAWKALKGWRTRSAANQLMTWAWPPTTLSGRVFCEKCLHRSARGDPRRGNSGEITMSGRFNWPQIGSRERARRQGVEDIKGKTPLVGQPPKIRLKLSKAELRQQAAAAFLAWRADQTAKDKK